jgi:hypothetical protein
MVEVDTFIFVGAVTFLAGDPMQEHQAISKAGNQRNTLFFTMESYTLI